MNHRIAFFSESTLNGKISRDYHQMRTDCAWFVGLDATHYHLSLLPKLDRDMYDLGIVIIPKELRDLTEFPLINEMKRVCKKIGTMQEGPSWYFQDYPMEQQIWFFNTLMEMDVIFAHNQNDVRYYKGLTGKENVFQNKSLMIEDKIEPHIVNPDARDGVIIGGNMVRWYGGFDSYIVAQEFGEDIFAPSMGRKIDREDEMDINHLPYMTWVEWINTLSQFHSAVHLMPTHAAGTFTLNCAFHGIPCIGYRGLDTQEELHPELTVDDGDLKTAKELANKLKMDKEFYDKCSKTSRDAYRESLYTEENFIPYIEEIFERLR